MLGAPGLASETWESTNLRHPGKLMRRSIFTALLLAATLASAQTTKRPMTFEDMMHMNRLGSTAVSPDGKWLGYSVTTVDLEKNAKTTELWLQPIAPSSDKGRDPIKLSAAQPGDDVLQFSPDNKRVLFTSSREGGQQIWLADFDPATGATGNPKKLTTISTEADNAKWSPDSKSIVFTSAVYPDCLAITTADPKTGDDCNKDRDKANSDSKVKAQIFTHLLYRHWNHFTGDKRSHLFIVSVEKGEVRDLTPNDPHDVPPFSLEGGGGFDISPDSKELAFTENLDPEPAVSTNADIFTLDLTNPAAKPVKVSTSLGGDFNPAYSPDGKYLAWRSQLRPGYESDKFRLLLYDRTAKTTKDLLPKFENWVDEFAWAPDSKYLYFTSGEKGEAPVFATNLEGMVEKLWTDGEASDLHPLAAHGDWLASVMTVAKPGEVVHFKSEFSFCSGGECPGNGLGQRGVTHINDALLAQLDLQRMIDFWFTANDGTKVQGFLIPPPAFDPAKKYPVKFLIHGGPQGAWGDSWSYRWNAELFAANGYVVVMINPVGSTGYGRGLRRSRQRRLGEATTHFTDPHARPHLRRAALPPSIEKDPRVRPRRQLRRLHGQLGPRPHQPLQVHRLPRRHVQRRIRLRHH